MITSKVARGCLVPVPADAPWAVGDDNRRVASWTLYDEPISIGRAADCTVVVRDPSVSRRHATLAWNGASLMLHHESLTSPTLLNGVPVARNEPTVLTSTDSLQIGGARFELLMWNADNNAETVPHAPPRALAVVLAADVVGYTALCKRDEPGTLQRFHECLRIFRHHAQRNRGRVLDTGEKGDCVYSLYHSVVLALSAVVAISQEITNVNRGTPADLRIQFRYGMHCGDVVLEGAGIRGDAINTAAHLQEQGKPGEIIVSPRIRADAEAHSRFQFEPVHLSSMTSTVAAYRLVAES